MKKIMILGASILQIPAITKAKEMGLLPVVVDMNPEAIGFKEDGIVKEVISTIDKDGILEAAKRNQIDGIMTLASDMPMQSVAYVAKEIGLVSIDEQTALNCTNKAYMRDCLKEHEVPIPEYFRVFSKEQYDKAIGYFRENCIPCIVKPADNSGSRGVDKLNDLYDLGAVNSAFTYSKENSRSGEIVVEEYMDGAEVSVETLSIKGTCHVIQITDKLTSGAPYFVEMGHNEPSMLPEEVKESIAEVAKVANKAVGIEDGPSHTEIKVTKSGPKIVELGARLGGDNITTFLVPLSTGVDMVKCCIQIALGEEPDIEKKFNKGSAIRYLKTDVGKIESIIGVEDAREMPGVKAVELVYGVGDEAKEIYSSVDRVGFVIAQDETPERAIEDAEKALKQINTKII